MAPEREAEPSSMPAARLLFRSPMPVAFRAELSAGCLNGSLIAAQGVAEGLANAFISTGCSVWQAQCQAPDKGSSAPEQGKEGMLVPTLTSEYSMRLVTKHRAEVQSILCSTHQGEVLVSSVDSYGTVIQSRQPDIASAPTSFVTLSPVGKTREPGWAGIAMTPQQGTLAMVRQHARDLSIFDGDTLVRTLHMANVPGALTLLAPGAIGGTDTSLCAIAEGHQVSLWDCRLDDRAACIQRLTSCIPGQQLHTITSHPQRAHLLACAGTDSSIAVWDLRRMNVLCRWNPSHKYDITYLDFLDGHPDCAVTGGLDPEIICGCWERAIPFSRKTNLTTQDQAADGVDASVAGPAASKGPRKRDGFGFRGDASWLGLSKVSGKDIVMGLSSVGSLFVADFTRAGR